MAGNRTAFTEETDEVLVAATVADAPPENGLDPADLVDTPQPTPFHGVAAPTDVPSGDGRQLAKSGFSTRNLPLPLNYQQGSYHGGDPGKAVTVGRIDAIWLDDETGLVHYTGEFPGTNADAGEAIQHVVDGTITGVSVDVDSAELEMPDEAETEQMADESAPANDLAIFKNWRIAGITMVAIPAFQEAHIALGPHPDMPAPKDDAALAAAATGYFAPGTMDGPGWETQPVATERLRRYWTHGEGVAKIAWNSPGDFDRCRAHIGKYVAPQYLAGTCANLHKVATGAWPGHAPGDRVGLAAAGARMAASINLVASANSPVLPAAWFENPGLTGPTPLTVTDEGRIYAHVATWGTCHISYANVCTTAPESFTNYAYFRTGAVSTENGDIAVGHITMDGGHAPMRANAKAAAAHYDNTASVAADVAAGEDAYGIWIAGAVRPGLPEEKRAALKAAALSGDWRSIGGHLEMVAALAVNVPGFPIPRTSLAASGEHQDSLVAAGVVTKENTMALPAPAPAAPHAAPPAPHPDAEKPHVDPEVAKAISAIDAALDAALMDPSQIPPAVLAHLQKADEALDGLMKTLGIPDPDDDADAKAPTTAQVAAAVRHEFAVQRRAEAARQKIRAAVKG